MHAQNKFGHQFFYHRCHHHGRLARAVSKNSNQTWFREYIEIKSYENRSEEFEKNGEKALQFSPRRVVFAAQIAHAIASLHFENITKQQKLTASRIAHLKKANKQAFVLVHLLTKIVELRSTLILFHCNIMPALPDILHNCRSSRPVKRASPLTFAYAAEAVCQRLMWSPWSRN